MACTKRPQYPDAPQLELLEAKKMRLPDKVDTDSLFIKLKFRDGDGNLGMNITDEPVNEITYVLKPNSTDTVTLEKDPHDCENYIKLTTTNKYYKITRNPSYYNFFITFYEKKGASYSKINLENCATYNGRFSRFDPGTNYRGPLEGSIDYGIALFLELGLKNKTARMEIYIQDRAMNKSNVITTQDFKF
jgi:hypothetical protein